ncbi:MAG: chitosanase, partial [Anaerolineae bacterium]
GEFDPAAWRDTIWAVTSIFESGKPEGNPAAYQTYDAGIISYGKHQATLASGTLHQVMLAYFERSDTAVSQTLQTEYADRIAQRDQSLRTDERLKELLLAAAEEPAMSQAQDGVFDGRFYQPAVKQAKAHNLSAPLGLACLYDTQIQGGLFIVLPRVVEKLGGIVGESGNEGLIDETAFIAAFLDEREARLLRLADQFEANGNTANAQALRISTFRVTEYRKLLDAGNLALAGTLNIRGQSVDGVS